MRNLPWLLFIASLGACASFPGVRPEGLVRRVSSIAPVTADSVYRRADQWMRAQGYTITASDANRRIVGYRLMSSTGNMEVRSELALEIETTALTETRFALQARTLRGSPPVMSEVNVEPSPAFTDMETLRSRLTCPNARWSTCPG